MLLLIKALVKGINDKFKVGWESHIASFFGWVNPAVFEWYLTLVVVSHMLKAQGRGEDKLRGLPTPYLDLQIPRKSYQIETPAASQIATFTSNPACLFQGPKIAPTFVGMQGLMIDQHGCMEMGGFSAWSYQSPAGKGDSRFSFFFYVHVYQSINWTKPLNDSDSFIIRDPSPANNFHSSRKLRRWRRLAPS